MNRYQDAFKILTTLLITVWMEFNRRIWKGTKMLPKYSQLESKIFDWNLPEEHEKVLSRSQNTHNSTHNYMNGIYLKSMKRYQDAPKIHKNFPKNMTRYQDGPKILTNMIIAMWMEFTRRTHKGTKMLSTHSQLLLIYRLIAIWMGFTRRIWKGTKMLPKYSQLWSNYMNEIYPKNMKRYQDAPKILTTLPLPKRL